MDDGSLGKFFGFSLMAIFGKKMRQRQNKFLCFLNGKKMIDRG